ncbi:hypothetical protein SDC9_120775 [bioreactor metagenome]|uniref:Uncharacterized protein n=1 Tax=bioreactor metagenome TaxID=1076179 RepID=A0A645CA38_9ZZZZ
MQLALRVVANGLVRIEITGALEDPAIPAVHAVAGDLEGIVVERLGVVVELGEIQVGDRAHALAARAHTADQGVGALLGSAPRSPLDGDGTRSRYRRRVERVCLRPADMRLRDPAEQHPEKRIRVRGGAQRRAHVGSQALLVDDDRSRQAVQLVDLGTIQGGHESLDECAVGLVDHPL